MNATVVHTALDSLGKGGDKAPGSTSGAGGWQTLQLGNFISLRRGHDLPEHRRRQGTVPVMGAAGRNGYHDAAIAKAPGVTLGRSGASYGQAHYCAEDYWPHNTALYVTDFKQNDPLFVYYFLDALDFNRYNSGGAQPSLNRNFIYPIWISVPIPEEQRIIAGALSDVDALISSLDKLVTKKRAIKLGVIQQLLTGKTRLPGFTKSWREVSLAQFGKTYGGLAGKSIEDFGCGEARYIPFLNIMSNVVLDMNFLEPVQVASTEHQNAVRSGDIFFNGSSETAEELGMCAVLLHDVENLYLNSFCFGFRFSADADENPLFLAYYFRSGEGRRLLFAEAQGAIRYNLSKTRLLRLPLCLPHRDEQDAIVSFISDMDAEVAALEHSRDKTKTIKQGIMQDLLTGRTRLV